MTGFLLSATYMLAHSLAPAENCDVWALKGNIFSAPGRTVEAVLIRADKVEAAGSEDLLVNLPPECVSVMPVEAVALPGLHDGHAHLVGIGLREMTLNLEGTASITELKARIESAAASFEKDETLYGRGWIETGWPEGRMPVAADLDEVVRDRPVILVRADGHAAVVNSRALEAAGISQDTPDPEGGKIERLRNGQATGLLIDTAMSLTDGLLPELNDNRRRKALATGASRMARLGWTSVHNMSVHPDDVLILEEMADSGELPIRVFNYLSPENGFEPLVETGTYCAHDDMVCTNGLKFYADGALGSRGALLFEDYHDQPGTRGLQLISREEAIKAYRLALENDVQVTTHAIGDRANYLVTEWYAEAMSQLEPEEARARRWRIEHAQIVRPEDIPAFGPLSITPSMQPSHAIGDLKFAATRLGDERLHGAYAWKSFVDEDILVVGGSDAPVEQGDPRIEIFAATRREALDGFKAENWHPEEALGQDEAIAIFTTNAARAVFMENKLGQLEPGYYADITVFTGNPFSGAWDATLPLMTIVSGEIKYQN